MLDPTRAVMPVTPGAAAGIFPFASTRAIEGFVRQPDDGIPNSVAGCIAHQRSSRRRLSDFERSTGGVERDDYLSLGRAASAAAKERNGEQQPEKARRECRAPLDEMSQERASRRKWIPLKCAACRCRYQPLRRKSITGTRLHHDHEILGQALALEVLEVVADLRAHVVDRRVVRVVDLRPAGDAGARALAEPVRREILAQAHEDARTLGARADDVHVALDHVHQLRQLVETRATQNAAELRDARIVPRGPHGARFRSASARIVRNL